MSRSRYDELHDKYYALLSTKAGTRYERLAAVVFKVLDEQQTVIHDLKLVGDSTVSHQIDVTIDRRGVRRRILIECKDFDVSGDKVGLGIVRDFSAVVADTSPDESYIVTCCGFTEDAKTFARAKGISLAVLREFSDEDWQGRVKRVQIEFRVVTVADPEVEFFYRTEEGGAKLTRDLADAGLVGRFRWMHDRVFVVDANSRMQVNEFITKQMKADVNTPAGPVVRRIGFNGIGIEVESRGVIDVAGMVLKYNVVHSSETVEVGGDQVGALVLEGMPRGKVAIWDRDLARFRLNDEIGEVKDAAV